jgi:hypothetical protein
MSFSFTGLLQYKLYWKPRDLNYSCHFFFVKLYVSAHWSLSGLVSCMAILEYKRTPVVVENLPFVWQRQHNGPNDLWLSSTTICSCLTIVNQHPQEHSRAVHCLLQIPVSYLSASSKHIWQHLFNSADMAFLVSFQKEWICTAVTTYICNFHPTMSIVFAKDAESQLSQLFPVNLPPCERILCYIHLSSRRVSLLQSMGNICLKRPQWGNDIQTFNTSFAPCPIFQ